MDDKQIMNKILEFYQETIGDITDELTPTEIIESLIQYYSAAGFNVENMEELVRLILGYSYKELLMLRS